MMILISKLLYVQSMAESAAMARNPLLNQWQLSV